MFPDGQMLLRLKAHKTPVSSSKTESNVWKNFTVIPTVLFPEYKSICYKQVIIPSVLVQLLNVRLH
jgi:hypothetical protein